MNKNRYMHYCSGGTIPKLTNEVIENLHEGQPLLFLQNTFGQYITSVPEKPGDFHILMSEMVDNRMPGNGKRDKMKNRYLCHSLSMLTIIFVLSSGIAVASTLQNISPLSIAPPVSSDDTVTINNNDSLILSGTENTDTGWSFFKLLSVGENTDGTLIIDGRNISTSAGSIGENATGSVILTNGATWTLDNKDLVLGTKNGSGTLLVTNDSKINGIAELRIGEYAGNAEGLVSVEGTGSSVSSGWAVVGDQGKGILLITNGGSLSLTEQMNIGYVGNTNYVARNGYGETLVDGANSTLNVTRGIYLGGFDTS